MHYRFMLWVKCCQTFIPKEILLKIARNVYFQSAVWHHSQQTENLSTRPKHQTTSHHPKRCEALCGRWSFTVFASCLPGHIILEPCWRLLPASCHLQFKPVSSGFQIQTDFWSAEEINQSTCFSQWNINFSCLELDSSLTRTAFDIQLNANSANTKQKEEPNVKIHTGTSALSSQEEKSINKTCGLRAVMCFSI